MTTCHATLPKIFAFPIVEGDIDCLKEPEKVMVPQSLVTDFKKIGHEDEQIRLVPLTDIYYRNETQDGGTFRSGNQEVTNLLFV